MSKSINEFDNKIIVQADEQNIFGNYFNDISASIKQYSITPETRKHTIFRFKSKDELISSLENEVEIIKSQENNLTELTSQIKIKEDSFLEAFLYFSKVAEDTEFSSQYANQDRKVVNDFISKKNEYLSDTLKNYKNEIEKFKDFYNKLEASAFMFNFIEDYSFNDENARRYGLNFSHLSEKATKKLEDIYSKPIKKSKYQRSDSSNNSKKSNDSKDSAFGSFKQLSPIEIFNIRQSLDDLIKSTNKAIIVDIFARNKEGIIQTTGGKIETHSVILIKNTNIAKDSKLSIMILDPNNSDFSNHIANNSFKILLDKDLRSQIGNFINTENLKLYSVPEGKKAGPNYNEFRDCIDIATKLTFAFNREKSPNLKKITDNDFIKELSNNPNISSLDYKEVGLYPLRVRQASRDEIKKISNKYLKDIIKQEEIFKLQYTILENFNIKSFDNYNSLLDNYLNEREKFFKINLTQNNEYTHEKFIFDIKNFLKIYLNSYGKYLINIEVQDMLGMEKINEEYYD